VLSAYFILTANSFMQNPVGYINNPETGRAELTDFWAVLTNPVQLVTFPHVIAAAWMTGGGFVLAIGMWHVWRVKTASDDKPMYRKAARLGAVIVLVGGLTTAVTGDTQGKIMTEVQPMKMAAAEALYETVPEGVGAPFSILTVGTPDGKEEKWAITAPKLLSFLATGTFDGEVKGINDLNEEYQLAYSDEALTAAADYRPVIPVTYWAFRWMIGLGMAAAGVAALALWALRGDRPLKHRLWFYASLSVFFMPLFANSFGWIFTETGRQPWVVFGVLTTSNAVSPGVSLFEVALSMTIYTLVYAAAAVVMIGLTLRYAKAGAEHVDEESFDPKHRADDAPYVFTY